MKRNTWSFKILFEYQQKESNFSNPSGQATEKRMDGYKSQTKTNQEYILDCKTATSPKKSPAFNVITRPLAGISTPTEPFRIKYISRPISPCRNTWNPPRITIGYKRREKIRKVTIKKLTHEYEVKNNYWENKHRNQARQSMRLKSKHEKIGTERETRLNTMYF